MCIPLWKGLESQDFTCLDNPDFLLRPRVNPKIKLHSCSFRDRGNWSMENSCLANYCV